MHLYSNLEHLQDRALYCDTDSVVYIQKETEHFLKKLRGEVRDVTTN